MASTTSGQSKRSWSGVSAPLCPPVSFTVSRRSFVSQGPTRPAGWTDGKKKWNHGAPLSKKAKVEGVGRGNNPKSHGNKPRQQDKQSGGLGDTVPLPAQRCSACKHCIVDYLSDTCGMCAEIAPLLPENRAGPAGSTRVLPPVPVALAPASPNLISSGPRVRGWLQREIDEGLCVAPVAQVPVLCARAA